MEKKIITTKFPFKKGDKVWVVINGTTPVRREVIGISPINHVVRLKDAPYRSPIYKVGKTKAEALAKAIIKETEYLEWSMERLLRQVKRRKNEFKNLSKLRTKLRACYK